jgi:hypothetical protein
MFKAWCRRFAAVAGLFGVLLFSTSLPAAEAPVGIVMAVSGTTTPPVSPMTEIAADSPIKLDSGSKLTFLDYARCKLVTVSGGTVTLSRLDYKTDGHVENEADGPCPHVYSVKDSGDASHTTGGLLMRGGLGPPRWPVNSVFLLTGAGASNVKMAAVYPEDQPGKPSAMLEVGHGRAAQTPGSAPLLANTRYVLRLSASDGSKPAEITFIGTASSDPQPVVVLRLD